jgi:hypothetical protein
MKTTLGLLVAMMAPSVALAEEAPPPPPPPPAVQTTTVEAPKKDRGEVTVAVRVGALFPQAFSPLQTSYLVDLELGYAFPKLKHRLMLAIDGAFTAPEMDGQATDPRLDATTGGAYTWHLQQRVLQLGLTLFYRHPIGRWVPYIGVGPRLFLLDTKVVGSAMGAGFELSDEQSTKVGVGIPVGVGMTLGPGHLFLEFAVNISNIDHRTTGATDVGSSSMWLTLGYRLSAFGGT